MLPQVTLQRLPAWMTPRGHVRPTRTSNSRARSSNVGRLDAEGAVPGALGATGIAPGPEGPPRGVNVTASMSQSMRTSARCSAV